MLNVFYFILLFCLSCKKYPLDSTLQLPLKEVNTRIIIGSPIDISYNNEAYMKIIKTELSSGQSLWYAGEGGWLSKREYDFSTLNTNINWMVENGFSNQVHMLVGPDYYMPQWLVNGFWQKTELDNLLRELIYSIMDTNDNKNKVDIWNVANELFEDDGSYRMNMIWNRLGWETDGSTLVGDEIINMQHPVFIRKAFTYCRQKSNRKLELRDDYNYENVTPTALNNKRQKAVYQLLKHMLKTNIPIDAIGIQGHISVGKTDWSSKNKALQSAILKFKSLGLEVYITELDASIDPHVWTSNIAQKQKEDYYNYVKQAIAGGVTRINFWGIQDGFDKYWLTTKHPLLWNDIFEKKPAYFGVHQALTEANK